LLSLTSFRGESCSRLRPPFAQARDMREPCVYLLASHYRGTLYCGVTSDLIKRVWEHRNDFVPGFTHRYAVHQLVWYEQHATMEHAIAREKAIKEWKRAWKVRLIERTNPHWHDMYPSLIQ
jgi:putative endonuclease